jgi:hypothetical protein
VSNSNHDTGSASESFSIASNKMSGSPSVINIDNEPLTRTRSGRVVQPRDRNENIDWKEYDATARQNLNNKRFSRENDNDDITDLVIFLDLDSTLIATTLDTSPITYSCI